MRLSLKVFLFSILVSANFLEANSDVAQDDNLIKTHVENFHTIHSNLSETWNTIGNTTNDSFETMEWSIYADRLGFIMDEEVNPVVKSREREMIVEDSLDGEERMLLKEFKIKTNVICFTTDIECDQMTMQELIRTANITLKEKEKNIILKVKGTSSLNTIPASAFVVVSQTDTKETSALSHKLKIWLNIFGNSFLLGAYVFWVIPFYKDLLQSEKNDKMADRILEGKLENVVESHMQHKDNNMLLHMSGNVNVTKLGNKEREIKAENCIENILCLHPHFGDQVLTSFLLMKKVLQWIPGLKNLKSRLKSTRTQMVEAVARGRYKQCHIYGCQRLRGKSSLSIGGTLLNSAFGMGVLPY